MTKHRIANVALFVLACIVWAFAMDTTYHEDHDSLADQERREWMQAIQFCHRTAGPQTAPEYTEDNRLVCVGRKGQRHNEVRLAKQ